MHPSRLRHTSEKHRQFFSLLVNVCYFYESLHRGNNLKKVKYVLVYYYWGFHGHKRYIQRRSCHKKVSNESPCKFDKRKWYLTVKVINGAVKQRPVKSISSLFSGELVMRPVTFSSSSVKFYPTTDFSLSQNKIEHSYSNSCYKCSIRSYEGSREG